MCFFFLLRFRRKWLPPPLRKLSQGKVDKTSNVAERPLVKKGSEKTFKLSTNVDKLTVSTTEDETNVTSTTTSAATNTATKSIPTTSATSTSSTINQTNNLGAQQKLTDLQSTNNTQSELEAEEEFELPPPMKPIQDAQSIINNGPTVTSCTSSTSATVAEQSPCKRVSLNTFFFFALFSLEK